MYLPATYTWKVPVVVSRGLMTTLLSVSDAERAPCKMLSRTTNKGGVAAIAYS